MEPDTRATGARASDTVQEWSTLRMEKKKK